jgi:hypothetical protein
VVRQLVARSISRSVIEGALTDSRAAWQVLAVFDRACDLVTPAGDVIAIVLPDIGDGPLNVVVEGRSGAFAAVQPGTTAKVGRTTLRIGALNVTLDRAATWEPRPDWERLRRSHERIQSQLPLLERYALERMAPGLTGFPTSVRSGSAFQGALLDLRAGWDGDLARLGQGAAYFAGLGAGLTPAGDDFLAGLMLRAWLLHPEPRTLCPCIVEIAAPRTTTLSATLLRAAGRGECTVTWHRLLEALQTGSAEQLEVAAEQVLSYGHSSGADTLAGFFCCGTC